MCSAPRVGTRRTQRSGSTQASTIPVVSRSEADVVYRVMLLREVLEPQQTRAPFIHARISRAPLPRSRSPCTMGYCPRVPFAVSVDFPWGWPGLLPCLAPPLTCSLPLQPGFPRAPSMWSRHFSSTCDSYPRQKRSFRRRTSTTRDVTVELVVSHPSDRTRLSSRTISHLGLLFQ